MGTRHLIAVVLDGEFRVGQYGQWDGYLTGQGLELAKFLETVDLEKFKTAVRNCKFLTDEEIEDRWKSKGADGSGTVTMAVANKFKETYLELSRDAGAKVLEVILKRDGCGLSDSVDFAADSLFCEWAYVIDLDNNNFEIYKGFNQEKLHETERFSVYNEQVEKKFKAEEAERKKREEETGKKDTYKPSLYYPVKLLWTFGLGEFDALDIKALDDTMIAYEEAEEKRAEKAAKKEKAAPVQIETVKLPLP